MGKSKRGSSRKPKPAKRRKAQGNSISSSNKSTTNGNKVTKVALLRLREINRQFRSNTQSNSKEYSTVIDNGAQQSLVGTRDWVIEKKYNLFIQAERAFGTQAMERLQIVDAYTTTLNDSGKPIAIIHLNQAIFCQSSIQTLIAEDQLEYNGVEVHSRAKTFGGAQCIIARHPKSKKPLKFSLGWDGSSKFMRTKYPSKAELESLPHVELTQKCPYNPNSSSVKTDINRMYTHRNRAFQWNVPSGKKFDWTQEQLNEWKARLNFTTVERVKKTFQATTQL